MKDVEKIDWMVEFYFGVLQDAELEKDKLSASKMLVDLMNLKFKYLGVERVEKKSSVSELEVRRRLSEAGVKLSSPATPSPSESAEE